MSDPRFNELREASWRRKLTASEEAEVRAWLLLHPDAQADWDSEMVLNENLDRLPAAPVPTNFTARVLQAVQVEVLARDQPTGPGIGRWRWMVPKVAWGAIALCLGFVYYGQQRAAQRSERARSVAVVSDNVAIMPPDLLQDLEPIRRLSESAGPDETLLALME